MGLLNKRVQPIVFDDTQFNQLLGLGGSAVNMPLLNKRAQPVLLEATQFAQLLAAMGGGLLTVETGIIASPTQTQAGATPLTKEYNRVDVCAALNDSLRLPKAVTGKVVLVGLMYNLADAPQIFPAVGDEIQASGGVDQPRPMSVGTLYTFYASSDTLWNFTSPTFI